MVSGEGLGPEVAPSEVGSGLGVAPSEGPADPASEVVGPGLGDPADEVVSGVGLGDGVGVGADYSVVSGSGAGMVSGGGAVTSPVVEMSSAETAVMPVTHSPETTSQTGFSTPAGGGPRQVAYSGSATTVMEVHSPETASQIGSTMSLGTGPQGASFGSWIGPTCSQTPSC